MSRVDLTGRRGAEGRWAAEGKRATGGGSERQRAMDSSRRRGCAGSQDRQSTQQVVVL